MPSKSAGSDSKTTWDSSFQLPPEFQPDQIVRDLQERQVSQSRTSKVQRFIERTKPFVNLMQNHAKAIDIASNACPEIICPLWAPLRALLNVRSAVYRNTRF